MSCPPATWTQASFPGVPGALAVGVMCCPPALTSRLDKTCVDLLQATLCLPTCPEQLQVLCAAILREMSPSDSLTLSCDHAQNIRQLSLVASVLLAQVTKLLPLGVNVLPLVVLGPGESKAGWLVSLLVPSVLGGPTWFRLTLPSAAGGQNPLALRYIQKGQVPACFLSSLGRSRTRNPLKARSGHGVWAA